MVAVSLVSVAVLLAVSCSRFSKGTSELSPESRSYASSLFESAKASRAAGDLDRAALSARELINNYPLFPFMDEAIFLAGEIALTQGRYAAAATHFGAVAERYPLSPFRQSARLRASRTYEKLEMYSKSAASLLEVLESPVDSLVEVECVATLRELVDHRLTPAELEALVRQFPSSPLNREIALRLARLEYAQGDYDRTYELLGEYLYRFPEETEAIEARRLLKLAAERRQSPQEPPPGVVKPNTVGIVLPVTGELSLYGRYFEEGIRLALADYGDGSGRRVSLAIADSKGTPVDAVKAVRKLVLEDGAVGLLGSVFTAPTIAAAIEANAWKVSLLSPVVSANGLVDIGPWIFETRVPPEVEVSAISNVAVTQLSLERFAIVAPSRGPGRTAADLFGQEVTRLGGEVVIATYYEEGATDFREQLEAVWESAPEALFVPGSVNELLTLLPQVKFYDLQIQLLGLSNWNSEKLLRLYSGELEGAMFPLETYHGKDREAYLRFKETLEKKGADETNPITVAGYFGMRLMLDAIASGASDRREIRDFLDAELRQSAEQRMTETQTLSILTVRSGEVREFNPPPPVDR